MRPVPKNPNNQPNAWVTTHCLKVLRPVFEKDTIYVFIITDDIQL